MRYFRRHWDEDRGDEHADWGGVTYYFEVDEALMPTRQIEIYDAGPTLRYSKEAPTAPNGFLSDQPLDSNDFAPFEVNQAVFEVAWQSGIK